MDLYVRRNADFAKVDTQSFINGLNIVLGLQNELPFASTRPQQSTVFFFLISSMTFSFETHRDRTNPPSTGEGGETRKTGEG